ncbi:hypothetical protein, partial [Hymenobacter rubidus]|uniref:hypothetical protein n=1 Tax=Hymenobacter rubidus TaxID=1441626 RepID=UPI00191F4E84
MAVSQTRVLSLLVGALALLNVGLLALLWLGRPGHAPRKPPPPAVGPVAAYVVPELGLTRQQQQQYEALRQQHQARMRQ